MTLLRAIGRGLAGVRRSPLIQLVAVTTIALSLVLVGVVELAASNVGRLAGRWGRNVQMTVYLEQGVSATRMQQIAAALGQLPGVAGVHTVSAHQAYERLRAGLGPRSDLLDGVEEGFFPASIEVALKPGVEQMMRLRPAYEHLRRLPGVDEVDLQGDWASRLSALEQMLRDAGLAVGALVLCACLYIVASTIRLGVFARRDEIEILKLVGATDGFVKTPFLVEGALQGALGSALAGGLLYLLFRLAAPHVQAVLGGLLAGGPLGFFAPAELAFAVLAGALLGLSGSALALGRYVKV